MRPSSRTLPDELWGRRDTRKGQGLRLRNDRRRARSAGREARFRIHQAAGGHRAGLRPSQAGGWRRCIGSAIATTARRHVEASFRVQGKAPELWHAETGAVEACRRTDTEGDRTVVPLTPRGERRCVRGLSQGGHGAVAHYAEAGGDRRSPRIEGSWDVAFQPDRGAPAKITLPPWLPGTRIPIPGVKYFSGTGTYTKTIRGFRPPGSRPGAKLWLDLGDVKNIARGDGQRKAAGHILEGAFPGGCDAARSSRERTRWRSR